MTSFSGTDIMLKFESSNSDFDKGLFIIYNYY